MNNTEPLTKHPLTQPTTAPSAWQHLLKKLQSRKFWAAVLSFLTAFGSSFALPQEAMGRVILIVSGIGAMCVYMLSESRVDAERIRLEEFDLFADATVDETEWNAIQ